MVLVPGTVCLSLGMVLHSGSVTGPESLAKWFASFLAKKLFEAPCCQLSYEMCLPQDELTSSLKHLDPSDFSKNLLLHSSGCPLSSLCFHKIGNLHTKKKNCNNFFYPCLFHVFVTVPEARLCCLCLERLFNGAAFPLSERLRDLVMHLCSAGVHA